ncbi:MAG: hypothetical protein JW912_04325 [Sedimentisphaerales bacterium]|nr:hypothetical protein [Sedimentisphaerales bacterium]
MSQDDAKEAWVQKYAKRIFEIWQNWQGPLGVSAEYIEHLEDELRKQYDDHLKRSMIELNYPNGLG